ncbi:hypothetical protein COLO4_15464 [Corchorus olitorius]|uniref:PGG domain-containing protein n=1 Tax=Corchorus olitorius TaxID=93759 RepID=A0A1R3JMS3_9ROSI|nr:hypothetical protein COLO4_15464 [Corchorus olitorius]
METNHKNSSKNQYHSSEYEKLLAALKGSWKKYVKQFEGNDVVENGNIGVIASTEVLYNKKGMTALHIAAANGHTKFVENIVKLIVDENDSNVLKTGFKGGFTALHLAAMGGHVKMAKALVKRNKELTQCRDPKGKDTPLLCAVKFFSKHKLVSYLALETEHELPAELPFSHSKAGELMIHLTHLGFHGDKSGVLCRIIKMVPCLNKIREKKLSHERACKLVDHCLKALRNCCDEKQGKKYFKQQEILLFAARHGIVEIVTESLRYFPNLVFTKHGSFLVKYAIQWRQEKIFNLIGKTTALDKLLAFKCVEAQQKASKQKQVISMSVDKDKQPELEITSRFVDKKQHPSPSHFAAELPVISRLPKDSTAASQMQREMQWFKAIERIQHPRMREITSKDGETAFDLFSKNHKEMRENAEKWMKDTSNSSMVVSTLIATIAFAAAFTVPGGNNDEGDPIFLKKTSFKVFIFSDALALFSSVTSILMFLSVLTSCFKEVDFLHELPKRMLIGLASLFFALATLMVAFGAGLVIVLSETFQWVWGPIIFFALIPVTLFMMLQLRLFIEMVESTYVSIFHHEKFWKLD